jgi:hypothetical protein
MLLLRRWRLPVFTVSIEPFKSFSKADALLLGNEADHIAAGITAEAMIEVCFGIDGKGRGLFLMEGTEADIVGALLPELYAVGLYDLFKVMVSLDRLYVCFANPHKNLSREKWLTEP